ncbi:dipeptidase [Cyclobacteriaceae bacterium]|nr:dipeptidase [Cyclobacteriaceae bacterium]
MFADLHNHNHSRTYFWLFSKRNKRKFKDKYNAWTSIRSNEKKKSKGKSGALYSQSDMASLVEGNVKLTFNALYPIEKGFFVNSGIGDDGKPDLNFFRFLLRQLEPLRVLGQGIGYMDIPLSRVLYFRSKKYKYWAALLDEYRFITEKSGEKMSSSLYIPKTLRHISRRNKHKSQTGRYVIPVNNTQLQQSLANVNDITMVLTIEGGHALGTDEGNIDVWLRRIEEIKNNWNHPVFFMTLSHHFYNEFCGHAHSIPNLGKLIFNQEHGLKLGFNEDGWRVLRKLLSLDEQNQLDPQEKYRILIDVKHMNATSRREFYNQVAIPCLGTPSEFPVIASHVAYSGRPSLREQELTYDSETDDFYVKKGDRNNYGWNINICDEDIEVIVKTKGLIGINMDQRILGVPSGDKKMPEDEQLNNIKAIYNCIIQIVEVIDRSHVLTDEQKKYAWKCLSFGSDFEGLINPIDDYPTIVNYQDLKEALGTMMKKELSSGGSLLGLHTVDDVDVAVHGICFENASRFVKEHYPS